MRVLLHLLDTGVGGGRRVALSVAQELVKRRHEVGFLISTPGQTPEELRALTAEVEFVDLGTLRRPQGVVRAARIGRGYDLLYSHSMAPGQILGEIVARLARRPHVVHQHTFPVFSGRRSVRTVQTVLYRRSLAHTRFIAVAEHVRRGLIEVGVRPNGIVVVPNGVRIPEVQGTPARAEGPVRVGMLGRYDPGKGMSTFVAAARSIGDRGEAEFVIGGHPGPFRTYELRLREEGANAGVKIVEPGEDGEKFLRDLDVVVIPSRYEGSPLVLLEAMALGKAVIASDIPGIREVIGPRGAGILVSPEDPGALAEAIVSLTGDSQMRLDLGARARETMAQQYTLQGSLDRIVQILEEAGRRYG
ncbi:MAG: glycosyltransferase family 4 protein [Actinomycetota bacterium]